MCETRPGEGRVRRSHVSSPVGGISKGEPASGWCSRTTPAAITPKGDLRRERRSEPKTRLEAVREAYAGLVVEDVIAVAWLRGLMSSGRDIDQLKEAVCTNEPK